MAEGKTKKSPNGSLKIGPRFKLFSKMLNSSNGAMSNDVPESKIPEQLFLQIVVDPTITLR